MSKWFKAVGWGAALVWLSGCATAPPPVAVVDYDRMAAIEKAAARSGVRVVWVNPPELAR